MNKAIGARTLETETRKTVSTAEAAMYLNRHPTILCKWGRKKYGPIQPTLEKGNYRWRAADIRELLKSAHEQGAPEGLEIDERAERIASLRRRVQEFNFTEKDLQSGLEVQIPMGDAAHKGEPNECANDANSDSMSVSRTDGLTTSQPIETTVTQAGEVALTHPGAHCAPPLAKTEVVAPCVPVVALRPPSQSISEIRAAQEVYQARVIALLNEFNAKIDALSVKFDSVLAQTSRASEGKQAPSSYNSTRRAINPVELIDYLPFIKQAELLGASSTKTQAILAKQFADSSLGEMPLESFMEIVYAAQRMARLLPANDCRSVANSAFGNSN